MMFLVLVFSGDFQSDTGVDLNSVVDSDLPTSTLLQAGLGEWLLKYCTNCRGWLS